MTSISKLTCCATTFDRMRGPQPPFMQHFRSVELVGYAEAFTWTDNRLIRPIMIPARVQLARIYRG
jgi:hypothetical protein